MPKMLKRDWNGRYVKTKVELTNGHTRIPKGTVLRVRENYAGLRLETEACPHCGVSVFITRVPESEVLLLPKGFGEG